MRLERLRATSRSVRTTSVLARHLFSFPRLWRLAKLFVHVWPTQPYLQRPRDWNKGTDTTLEYIYRYKYKYMTEKSSVQPQQTETDHTITTIHRHGDRSGSVMDRRSNVRKRLLCRVASASLHKLAGCGRRGGSRLFLRLSLFCLILSRPDIFPRDPTHPPFSSSLDWKSPYVLSFTLAASSPPAILYQTRWNASPAIVKTKAGRKTRRPSVIMSERVALRSIHAFAPPATRLSNFLGR